MVAELRVILPTACLDSAHFFKRQLVSGHRQAGNRFISSSKLLLLSNKIDGHGPVPVFWCKGSQGGFRRRTLINHKTMVQQQGRSLAIASLILVALSATLFSFSSLPGGESFEIYVNNSMVVQQFVTRDGSLKSFILNEPSSSDVVKVYYNHCGKVGTARALTIKDAQNKVLKTWEFADNDKFMVCKAGDIAALQKHHLGRLNLYYSSKELSSGRILASIVSGNEKASLE
jgi:hypothetical protein